jgi:peroxin-5
MQYAPTFQPMYSNYLQQPQPQLNHLNRTQEAQSSLEAAFERALADAQSQTESTSNEQTQIPDPEAEEIIREPKGDLEAVWESLRPEAERLGKLAEWEAEFSQFVNDEDDLFEGLEESLNRDDVGQMGLDEQLEMGLGELGEGFDVREGLVGDDGLPVGRSYEFGQFPRRGSAMVADDDDQCRRTALTVYHQRQLGQREYEYWDQAGH